MYSLQVQHVYSTLKRRGNDRFHVVSRWNPRDVFVGFFFIPGFVVYIQDTSAIWADDFINKQFCSSRQVQRGIVHIFMFLVFIYSPLS